MLSSSRSFEINFISNILKKPYWLVLVVLVLNAVPADAQGRDAGSGEGATIQIKTKSPNGQQGASQWSGPRGYGNQNFKGQEGNFAGPGKARRSGGLDFSSLGLSEAQKQKITNLRSQNSGKAKDLQQAVKQRKAELKDLMFSPNASNTDIENKRSELFKLQEQHDKVVMNDFLAIRGVLTKEQLKLLPTIKPQRQGGGRRGGGQGPDRNWQGQGRGGFSGQDMPGMGTGDRPQGMPWPEPGMREDGSSGQDFPDMSGPGMEGRRMPGMGGQGMPGRGMSGPGMGRQGMPGPGMPGQGMPGQGMPGQGMNEQGRWNREMEQRRRRWRRQMEDGGQGGEASAPGFGRKRFQGGQEPGGFPRQGGPQGQN